MARRGPPPSDKPGAAERGQDAQLMHLGVAQDPQLRAPTVAPAVSILSLSRAPTL